MLSQSDVDLLLAAPTASARAAVADKLAAELDSPRLTDAERAAVHDLIGLLARDVEVTVRQALSHGLRHSKRLPHDLALRLASDVDAVALPLLVESAALTDADLIAIIRAGTPGKQEAIGGRRGVSEQVSQVLIEEAAESAVGVLVRNETALISERSLREAARYVRREEAESERASRARVSTAP